MLGSAQHLLSLQTLACRVVLLVVSVKSLDYVEMAIPKVSLQGFNFYPTKFYDIDH
jgi:hypothetical protein